MDAIIEQIAVPELIALTNLEKYQELGLTPLALFGQAGLNGSTCYSLRRGNHIALTLVITCDDVCSFIVGQNSRPPTAEELYLVTEMLLDVGVTTRYDPRSRV